MNRILKKFKSLIAVFLAFVLALLIGFVALRNPMRLDISDSNFYKLSDKTIELLDRLDRNVEVTVFFQQEHPLYDDIENLLEEYQYQTRNIHVRWIDPARDRGLTEKLANQYGLTESQVIVFDVDGKSKKVYQADLADKEMVKGRQEPVLKAFKGEQAFSSAIRELVQGQTPVVYFLTGHGEHRVTDFDQTVGYSSIENIIIRDNIEVKELLLATEKNIPDDAAALVVAGPLTTLSSIEIEIIEDYLNRSGRVMVMIDALKDGGLEDMLRRWGIALRNDVVVDPENTLRGNDVYIRSYNTHPICLKLTTIVQFFLPRSIEPLVRADGSMETKNLQTVVPLFYTSEKGWSETQLENTTARFDENTGDHRGPISLGVAVERGSRQDELDVQIDPSKMVVFGDSDFASNGMLAGGNADLLMRALNWLLDRDEVMAIAPKPMEEVKISLPNKQFQKLIWLHVGGIPFVAVVLGLLVWVRRRK